MKMVRPKYEKPIVGTGIAKLGKSSFSIDVKYGTGKDDHELFTFKVADLPEDLPDGWALKNGKEYFINVRADGSAINSIRPARGTFEVMCSGVVKDDDDKFLVIERDGDFGKYWQTVVNLTVVSGDQEGVIFPLYLPLASSDKKGEKQLRFVEDDDGNITIYGNPEKSRSIANLYDLIEYAGLADTEISFPDGGDEQDILAVFSKALRKAKVKFMLIVDKGYIKSMASLSDDEEMVEDVDDDDDVEEVEVPVKKSTKKVEVVDDEDDEDEPAPAKKKSKPQFDEED